MSSEYSEDALVQQTTAEFFCSELDWQAAYAYNTETFGSEGTFGRKNRSEVVLVRYLRQKLQEFNPNLPSDVYEQAIDSLTSSSASKDLLKANRELYTLVRDGVRVSYKDADGMIQSPRLKVIDFDHPFNNHFLVVREMWVAGAPYTRRPDLLGFVNGLPLLFIELKKSSKNVKVAYDKNLLDYLDTIPHLFHHNVLCLLSNGIDARAGTMTSPFEYFQEWKRLEEDEAGVVHWQTMLRALCNKERFLDVVENFVIFDDSSGKTIKALAANHQFLGVNRAFTAVKERKTRRGRLGVFWHTQGSGKSYSMLFLSQKVHRRLPGSFTFVILTDRVELDEQIARTFAGCGAVREAKAVHARDGDHLKQLLREEHRYIFTLIHKFNQGSEDPYTDRDDIIVIADEAHRTQYGRLAENMRRVLPNASYIAFTGTPLVRGADDQLTREIFGDYVSRYDFKQAVEDGATVPLYYDNRGEKLDIATPDINERIAEELEGYDLDQDQEEKLRRVLARDYHVLTADERLDRIARDVVAHLAKRWQLGKSMFVAVDKITCVRMYDLILKYWDDQVAKQEAKLVDLRGSMVAEIPTLASRTSDTDDSLAAARHEKIQTAEAKLEWLLNTEICVVVSEEQNEVSRFRDWGLDILPHRTKMKTRDLAEDFKRQDHPFRMVIVCAMWLTGFDVPCLSTMYLDKPMKSHTLMQAIARANRKSGGKNNGHLVDYNGMLKSLRAALATYGGPETQSDGDAPAADMQALLQEFVEALAHCENHLMASGYDLGKLVVATGFEKLAFLDKESEGSAVNAVCRTDETRARFEVFAREVLKKRRALVSEPEMTKPYKGKADAIEAIYKRLQDNKQTADISAVMMALRGVVSDAITHQPLTRLPGSESGKIYDISHIDFDKLRREFETHRYKNILVQSLKDAMERRLRQMIKQNPLRMDFYERYRKIVDLYNQETDRATIENTFAELVKLVEELTVEEQRAVKEGLSEEKLALFDLLVLSKGHLDPSSRNRVKKVAVDLLETIERELLKLDHWREKRQTQAQVQQMIYDYLYDESTGLPVDVFNDEEVKHLSQVIYLHFYDREALTQDLEQAG